MGKTYEQIDETIETFIRRQHMFFVATAPLAGDGLVNLSPKGLDTFRILEPRAVAYLDLIGSGIETVAHLRENGRITILFCAFDGPPRIMRLHGKGEVIEPGDARFDELITRFPPHPNTRAIIHVRCHRISASCGFGVPRYDFAGDRSQMVDWAERQGPEGMRAYKAESNAHSIDGLPGLRDPSA
jgi:hypothetical protein